MPSLTARILAAIAGTPGTLARVARAVAADRDAVRVAVFAGLAHAVAADRLCGPTAQRAAAAALAEM